MCAKAKATEKGGGADEGTIPPILRPWVAAYRAVPKLYIPGTTVDLAFSLASALVFAFVRISARYFLVGVGGWPAAPFLRAGCDGDAGCEATLFAAACLTSSFHCWTLLPALGGCLYHTRAFGGYVPSARMGDAPRWWQDAAAAAMAFCTGYMIYDTVAGYVVETWVPAEGKPVLNDEDVTYLGHHILCSLCMLSARLQGAGHLAVMVMMFGGEFTAPVMNAQLIFEKALLVGVGGGVFRQIAPVFEQFYCVLYILFRSPVFGVGYVSATHLTYDLFFTKRGRTNCSVWLTLAWMPMIWGVLFGSIPTLYDCFDILKGGPLGIFVGGGGGKGEEL